ncbi:MAG: hypothetical protein PWR10_191 [Halanaerobiales bacterium]|nr:hypothetical protein [Halanaerobiales bacterium]
MRFRTLILSFLTVFILISVFISAEDFLIYRVKKGDSLSEIARSFDLKLEELVKLNQIKNPDLIYIGQRLRIPAEEVEYTVKRGDTLREIASNFKVKMEKLVTINHLANPDRIYTGQKLIIPVSRNRDRYQLVSRSRQDNFIWPAQGEITSPYGCRDHPILGRREFHTGIDIAVPIGSPIYAAADGVVIFSGWSRGYGNLIIIKHREDRQTFYGHNIELLVKKGDIIKQGKIIALSGSTGLSTGPHLHFEIRIKGKAYDPMRFLNQRYFRNDFRI